MIDKPYTLKEIKEKFFPNRSPDWEWECGSYFCGQENSWMEIKCVRCGKEREASPEDKGE